MIAALVSGKLVSEPTQRVGASGKPYTLARVGVSTEGEDCLVSLIAFGAAGEQLAGLSKGDSISVTGRAKVTKWTKGDEHRAGLAITVDALLTPYHLQRKRRAMRGGGDD